MQSWSDGMRWNFALSRWGDGGVVDFCGCGGGPGEGIGTPGSAREAEAERRRNPWFWYLVLGGPDWYTGVRFLDENSERFLTRKTGDIKCF